MGGDEGMHLLIAYLLVYLLEKHLVFNLCFIYTSSVQIHRNNILWLSDATMGVLTCTREAIVT